ncbi:MAG: tetratricopeptide repeat protein, partial [Myxococcota bacterium]
MHVRFLLAALVVAPALGADGDLDPARLTPFPRRGVQGEFLAALDLVAKDPSRAARKLDDLRPRYGLIEDYLLYHAARAHYRAKRFDLSAARASRGAPHDSPLDAEARLLLADALAAAGRVDEARGTWREYLERYPSGMRLPEVYFRLGDYRRAYALGTLGPWEARAEALLGATPLTPEDRVDRAQIIARTQRHTDAEAEFARALDGGGIAPATECIARFERAEAVWRQRNRTRADPLYAEAARACARARDGDRHTRALYQQGRGRLNIGKPEDAAAIWAEAQEVGAACAHSYADDARLREAEAWIEAGKPDRAIPVLETLPDRFPSGDMRAEALWRLARLAWQNGRLEDALALLDRELTIGRAVENYAEGRAHYWRARVLDRLGRPEPARAAYESAIREYPLSYYALWAFLRLRGQHPGAAPPLEREFLAAIPENPPPLVFADRPLFHGDGFRRALELWRLGLRADARREFARVGVAPGGSDQDLLWLLATLLDSKGDYPTSHNLPRRTLTGYRVTWPHGSGAARWRIAYPRGFGAILAREAKRAGVPEALLLAIVREESGFDPNVVSYAHAYGLTQMIVPTARRFAEKPGRVTPARLLEPGFNAPIGARFLAFELGRYGRAAPLAVAAYNAGEG